MVLDELDKGASKRELARSTGVSRPTIRAIDQNRERYIASPEAHDAEQPPTNETEGE